MPSVVATLQALVAELQATIAEQRATIVDLRAANVRLEERDRARFNGLVDQHTTLLSRYRQVVAEVNQKVDEHNALLRSGS